MCENMVTWQTKINSDNFSEGEKFLIESFVLGHRLSATIEAAMHQYLKKFIPDDEVLIHNETELDAYITKEITDKKLTPFLATLRRGELSRFLAGGSFKIKQNGILVRIP